MGVIFSAELQLQHRTEVENVFFFNKKKKTKLEKFRKKFHLQSHQYNLCLHCSNQQGHASGF